MQVFSKKVVILKTFGLKTFLIEATSENRITVKPSEVKQKTLQSADVQEVKESVSIASVSERKNKRQ